MIFLQYLLNARKATINILLLLSLALVLGTSAPQGGMIFVLVLVNRKQSSPVFLLPRVQEPIPSDSQELPQVQAIFECLSLALS